MHQSYEAVYSLDTTPIFVPPGVTNAVLVAASPTQNSANIKYGTGGTILLFGCTFGTTMAPGAFASLLTAGNYYLMGTSESLSLNGPTYFYVAQSTVAATVAVYAIKGKNG